MQADARELVFGNADLLGACLSFVEPHDLLTSVPLVCKAFAAAQASPGACWAALELDGLRVTTTGSAPMGAETAALFWRKLAAWARRRAGGLRSLRLANQRHLLQQLEPDARLAALQGLWAALGGSSDGPSCSGGGGGGGCALRALEVGRSSLALPPGGLASLACLSQLRQLEVNTAGPLDTAELDALGRGLPALEELRVCLMRRRGEHCAFRGAFPAALARLPRLRLLHLEAPYSALNAATIALPDCASAWGSQLEELHLINMGIEALPPALGGLPRLRALCLARNRLGQHPGAVPWALSQYSGFADGPPAVVGELCGLEELNLSGNLWGSTVRDLPAEYSQLTSLKYLTLTNCELSALPPLVQRLSSLLLLKVNINTIQSLPGGAYLRSLECIDLAHNRFTAGYPRALAAATRLQLLSFQHNGVHYSDPAIALRDALAPPPPLDHPPPATAAGDGASAAAAAVAAHAVFTAAPVWLPEVFLPKAPHARVAMLH
ncbi:leucine rich repeat isoform A [Micractinium conductrix]|uniref:Leucine rich repeat isoform A n=1 Tax=Micractinium conductrix TaxID=554055 RepID=A0A2P6VG69_9CHLO|nr:leucine rich repeat isoform A [Micractinium conductrix]|eukprot:PSC73092.1 leucine rich repeat isoform A [Micractinium conductrix]